MSPWSRCAVWVSLAFVASGCAHRPHRDLQKASRKVGQAVARADAAGVRSHVAPGTRAVVDMDALAGAHKRAWARALSKPQEVHAHAIILLTPEHPVDVVWTEQGWRFAEDPTHIYAQDTPRHALRALVHASRMQRWDVLIQLAPKRYRMGLAQADLEEAWTRGEHAKALAAARDTLARHLADPLVADAHEAVLNMGDGHLARLEREGERWVVVDFLPSGP